MVTQKIQPTESESLYLYSLGLSQSLSFMYDDRYKFGIRFIDKKGSWTPIYILDDTVLIDKKSYYNKNVYRPNIDFKLSDTAISKLKALGYYQYILYFCNEENKFNVITQGVSSKLLKKKDAKTTVYLNSWFFRPEVIIDQNNNDNYMPHFNIAPEQNGADKEIYNFSISSANSLYSSNKLGSEIQFFSPYQNKGIMIAEESVRAIYEPLLDMFKVTKGMNYAKCVNDAIGWKTFTHIDIQTFTANTMYGDVETAGLLTSDIVSNSGRIVSGMPLWQDGLKGINVTDSSDVYTFMIYPWMGDGPLNCSAIANDTDPKDKKQAEQSLPSRLKKKLWSVSQLFSATSPGVLNDTAIKINKTDMTSDFNTFVFKDDRGNVDRYIYQKNNDIILNFSTDPTDNKANNFYFNDQHFYYKEENHQLSKQVISDDAEVRNKIQKKRAALQTGLLFIIDDNGEFYPKTAAHVEAIDNDLQNCNLQSQIHSMIGTGVNDLRDVFLYVDTNDWMQKFNGWKQTHNNKIGQYYYVWCGVDSLLQYDACKLMKHSALFKWQLCYDITLLQEKPLSSYRFTTSEGLDRKYTGSFSGITLFTDPEGNVIHNESSDLSICVLRVKYDSHESSKTLTDIAPYTTVGLNNIARNQWHDDSTQKIYLNFIKNKSGDEYENDENSDWSVKIPVVQIGSKFHAGGNDLTYTPYIYKGVKFISKNVSSSGNVTYEIQYKDNSPLHNTDDNDYIEISNNVDSPFYSGGYETWVPITLGSVGLSVSINQELGKFHHGTDPKYWGCRKWSDEAILTLLKNAKDQDLSSAYKYGIKGFRTFIDCGDDDIVEVGGKTNKIITASGRGCDHLLITSDSLMPYTSLTTQYGKLPIYNLYSNNPATWTEPTYVNSNFTVCSYITPIDESPSVVWGDTFYQRYYCLKHYGAVPSETKNEDEVTAIENVCTELGVLLETRNNLACRCDRNIYNKNKTLSENGVNHNLINRAYLSKFDMFDEIVMDDTFYDNNKDFSSDFTWSDMKTPNELNDTYCNINLSKLQQGKHTCGTITKIINFADSLFVFQQKGIGVINYNEKGLIDTSEGQISVGNSGVVNGIKYLSTNNGCLNRHCICSTNTQVVYLDSETMSFNGVGSNGIVDISSTYGMKTFFKNDIYQQLTTDSNGNFNYNGSLIQFDKINNELHIISNTDDLCYDCLSNSFMTFFDYEHTWFIDNFYKHYLYHNNILWEREAGDYNRFFGIIKPHYMEVLFNGDSSNDKIFTNISFVAEKYDNDSLSSAVDIRLFDNQNYRKFVNDTFNQLEVRNEYQNAHIDLRAITNIPSPLKQKFRGWNIQIPRVVNGHSNGRNPYGVGYGFDRIRNPWSWFKFINDRENDTLKHVFHGFEINYFE